MRRRYPRDFWDRHRGMNGEWPNSNMIKNHIEHNKRRYGRVSSKDYELLIDTINDERATQKARDEW